MLVNLVTQVWIILPTINNHFQSSSDYIKSANYDLFFSQGKKILSEKEILTEILKKEKNSNRNFKCQHMCDFTGHVTAEGWRTRRTGLIRGFQTSWLFECVNLAAVPVRHDHFQVVHHSWNAGWRLWREHAWDLMTGMNAVILSLTSRLTCLRRALLNTN